MAHSDPFDEPPPADSSRPPDSGQPPDSRLAPEAARVHLTRRPSLGQRFFRLFFRLIFLLLIVAAAALFFRVELINRAGPWLLTRQLAVPVDLSVRKLDWRGTHIDRLTLGSQRDVIVEDVDLTYNPWDGRLEAVEIGRVALLARYDTRLSLGELDPLVDTLRALATAPRDKSAETPVLPDVLVKAIDIGLASPAGFITGTGQANLNQQAVIAQFTLREQQDFARAEISLAAPLAPGGKPPLGDLTITMDAHSALWPLLGLAQPTGGSIKVNAHLRMPEGSAQTNNTGVSGAGAALALAEWSLDAVNFAYPGFAEPVSGTLKGAASYGPDWLAVDKLDGRFRGGLTLQTTVAVGGNLLLSPLRAAQKVNGALMLKAETDDLAVAGIGLKQPKLALEMALGGQLGGNLNLSITKPGTISARHVDLGGNGVTFPKPTTLTLRPDAGTFAHLTFGGGDGFAADFGLSLAKSTVTVEPNGMAERLLIAMGDAKITGRYADGMPLTYAVDVKGAQVAAPLRGLTLGDVALSLVADGKAIKGKLTTGALAGLGAFTPVRAEGEATLIGSKADFKAQFTGVDQPIDLRLAGKVDLAKLRGSVDLKLAPLDFSVGGLQPYNLVPFLRDYLDDVSGRVELEGPVRFAGADLSSALKFGLTNFSGKVGPVLLTNVNSVIEVDRPWPISTKPDQIVAVELADIGLPLTNALFRFKVSDGQRLDLGESHLELAGGKVSLDPARLVFNAPVHNLRLSVESISVGELFDTLGIAGLSGEGSISGEVPVTIFPGGIAIPAAKLQATAPGVLRYDRNQAPMALQSAGESVALALEALADFHYEKLILDLTRNLTGDVSLGLHIAGRNPSFYDGYPVEFNLTIEGRLDQALKEGLAGYKVPDMIQEKLNKLSP